MTRALYILHIVDDFGIQIPPHELPFDVFMRRYEFFTEAS